MKAIEYSVRYMLIIGILYYIIPLSVFYKLGFQLLGVIPINYFAIKYGIYNKIDKDNYVTKDFILLSLISYTTLFNTFFLILNKVNIFVVLIVIFVNIVELIYLDNPKKK